jgi:hypothetical protein
MIIVVGEHLHFINHLLLFFLITFYYDVINSNNIEGNKKSLDKIAYEYYGTSCDNIFCWKDEEKKFPCHIEVKDSDDKVFHTSIMLRKTMHGYTNSFIPDKRTIAIKKFTFNPGSARYIMFSHFFYLFF